MTVVRNAASNLRLQLEQLAQHIVDNLPFPRALFNNIRQAYLALFNEVLTKFKFFIRPFTFQKWPWQFLSDALMFCFF